MGGLTACTYPVPICAHDEVARELSDKKMKRFIPLLVGGLLVLSLALNIFLWSRLSSQGDAIVSRFALVDEWLRARIDVELERPAHLFRAPIETVSQSENGFERNYQGSLLLALWDLGGVVEWRIGLRQRITCNGQAP